VNPGADALVRFADHFPVNGGYAFFRNCVRCDNSHSLVHLVLPVRKFFFLLKQQALDHPRPSVRLEFLN
jgi:hypothetical protein